MDAPTIIAIVALVVSTATAYSEWKARRKQRELDERQTDLNDEQTQMNHRLLIIEEKREARTELFLKKALLVGTIYERQGPDYRIHIANAGHSTARNIRLLLDGTELKEHPTYCQQDLSKELNPGGSDEVGIVVYKRCRFKRAELLWDDDSGEPGKTDIAVPFSGSLPGR